MDISTRTSTANGHIAGPASIPVCTVDRIEQTRKDHKTGKLMCLVLWKCASAHPPTLTSTCTHPQRSWEPAHVLGLQAHQAAPLGSAPSTNPQMEAGLRDRGLSHKRKTHSSGSLLPVVQGVPSSKRLRGKSNPTAYLATSATRNKENKQQLQRPPNVEVFLSVDPTQFLRDSISPLPSDKRTANPSKTTPPRALSKGLGISSHDRARAQQDDEKSAVAAETNSSVSQPRVANVRTGTGQGGNTFDSCSFLDHGTQIGAYNSSARGGLPGLGFPLFTSAAMTMAMRHAAAPGQGDCGPESSTSGSAFSGSPLLSSSAHEDWGMPILGPEDLGLMSHQ